MNVALGRGVNTGLSTQKGPQQEAVFEAEGRL